MTFIVNKPFKTLAITLGMLGLCTTHAQAVEWNHDPVSNIGPPLWSTLDPSFSTCGSGLQQSPVDLSTTVLAAETPPLHFGYLDTALEIDNNGHTVEVPYETGSNLRIGEQNYRLLQFHFHVPSEHTVNGRRFDMEAHLVHINSLSQLAVVSVLMDAGGNPNALVDQVIGGAPDLEGVVVVPNTFVNARDLLPTVFNIDEEGDAAPVTQDYYSYPGSLTTPPCSEGVLWYVLKDPVNVSQLAIDRLHEIVSLFPAYEGYPDNNRLLQLLNGRQITEQFTEN
ncbi:Carbonic anhydrase, alpha class [hydrothermal vent metagenome]|uniref:carbonic anhydrase n=1 Tax=hydrothermal vent metagenome TaxID=652676 RepID=A0A3B0Y5N1_9ZZZZ